MLAVHRHWASKVSLRFDVLHQDFFRDGILRNLLTVLVLGVLVREPCHESLRDVRRNHLQQNPHLKPV